MVDCISSSTAMNSLSSPSRSTSNVPGFDGGIHSVPKTHVPNDSELLVINTEIITNVSNTSESLRRIFDYGNAWTLKHCLFVYKTNITITNREDSHLSTTTLADTVHFRVLLHWILYVLIAYVLTKLLCTVTTLLLLFSIFLQKTGCIKDARFQQCQHQNLSLVKVLGPKTLPLAFFP